MDSTITLILALASVWIAALGLAFGILKGMNASTHKRIDEVKSDFEKEIKDIKDNYAHKETINQAVTQIKELVTDLKAEQHRMALQFNDFWKWVVVQGKDKKKEEEG